MATLLPFNAAARLPLDEHPSLARWYRRLEEISAWRDPFEGLEAPELPAVPG
jgi:glutathione S-transferase